MLYSSEYHDSHCTRYSEDDLIYICYFWDKVRRKAEIALSLGRTVNSVTNKVIKLKCEGLFEHYKNLGLKIYN